MSSKTRNANEDGLAGHAAVVTGASKGIGRAIALELAKSGADLFLHTRADAAGLQETIALAKLEAPRCGSFVGDLTDDDSKAGLFRSAFEWRSRIDTWINNAGADVLTGDVGRQPFSSKLGQLWQVDVQATIELSREVGVRMKMAGAGCVINIGWDQAATGMAGDSGEMFAATKGAVMSFTRSLAKSLAPHVRVNCVAPGWIKTEWGDSASAQWDARAKRESLLGRWGCPEDVAAVVGFLASPAAQFVNGQVIQVNGGFNGAELF